MIVLWEKVRRITKWDPENERVVRQSQLMFLVGHTAGKSA